MGQLRPVSTKLSPEKGLSVRDENLEQVATGLLGFGGRLWYNSRLDSERSWERIRVLSGFLGCQCRALGLSPGGGCRLTSASPLGTVVWQERHNRCLAKSS